MKLEIRMKPFNTSMMGVIQGVSEYFGYAHSDAFLFGGSGHAFLVNIHEQICPSGPYVWNYSAFFRLLQNMGLKMNDLGFFASDTPENKRGELERIIKKHLDEGNPCSVVNMDNQIVYGYDEEALQLVQPWGPDCPLTPATLTNSNWNEFGERFHASFFTFERSEIADQQKIIKDSIEHAVDLFENPEHYQCNGYRIGLNAYEIWTAAVEEHGSSHGNWWNGAVWSECRSKASEYMKEIADILPEEAGSIASDLSKHYAATAMLLQKVSDKGLDSEVKKECIAQVKGLEKEAVADLKRIMKIICNHSPRGI